MCSPNVVGLAAVGGLTVAGIVTGVAYANLWVLYQRQTGGFR